MSLSEAVRVLVLGAGRRFPIIDRQGLRTLFAADGDHAFNTGLRRLIELGLVERLARGVYRNGAAPHPGRRGLGMVARHLRPGHLCYVSYESALAEFGSISQVPMVTIVATTGNGGEHRSPFGDLEFCHTSRSGPEILANTVFDDRLGLRFATPEMAYEDLTRVRPGNLQLVDPDIHAEVLADWGRSDAESAHA